MRQVLLSSPLYRWVLRPEELKPCAQDSAADKWYKAKQAGHGAHVQIYCINPQGVSMSHKLCSSQTSSTSGQESFAWRNKDSKKGEERCGVDQTLTNLSQCQDEKGSYVCLSSNHLPVQSPKTHVNLAMEGKRTEPLTLKLLEPWADPVATGGSTLTQT